jgi:hypothetical protein
MDSQRSNNKNEPRFTRIGKATEQHITTAMRFLSQELLMIACLVSTGVVLLQRFACVQLPFTYDTCYICLMLFLGFLMHLEIGNQRKTMALEGKGVLAPIFLAPIREGLELES